MSQYAVSIEFAGAGLTRTELRPEENSFLGLEIRVVETIEDLQRVLTLIAPDQPDQKLTAEECEQLLELCSQISVSAPWQAQMGFDGATSTLTLHGSMSQMSFSWWGDAPPEWQPAGAVFDYVMRLYRE